MCTRRASFLARVSHLEEERRECSSKCSRTVILIQKFSKCVYLFNQGLEITGMIQIPQCEGSRHVTIVQQINTNDQGFNRNQWFKLFEAKGLVKRLSPKQINTLNKIDTVACMTRSVVTYDGKEVSVVMYVDGKEVSVVMYVDGKEISVVTYDDDDKEKSVVMYDDDDKEISVVMYDDDDKEKSVVMYDDDDKEISVVTYDDDDKEISVVSYRMMMMMMTRRYQW
ncbi:hypothetical protein QZH41_007024 [Actinostola sp. cb2023]|nr:hypothetical protein QZH41_007024 [Actinostola sp. cb2023]